MTKDQGAGGSIAVLGATGHVGTAALDVAQRAGCEVVALAANSNVDKMAELAHRHRPRLVAMHDEKAGRQLADKAEAEGLGCEVTWGEQGVVEAAACEADAVVAAISGVAGVASTMAAARAGKKILLANKEALVTAGRHMIETVRANGAQLVPVDSEHGALLELLHLARDRRDHVARVWLTASGGPFHDRDVDLSAVSPSMATDHPVWSMGEKISVDSATLMNKGLEVIEASLLFGMGAGMISVVVHPQGLVHALVDFKDGGTVAHCSAPDMRHSVARALAWPDPHDNGVAGLDWTQVGTLEFKEPDMGRFPCLRLAHEALRAGGAAPAVLNAANEVAVQAFCASGRIAFTDIPPIVEDCLASVDGDDASLECMVEADRAARERAGALVGRRSR